MKGSVQTPPPSSAWQEFLDWRNYAAKKIADLSAKRALAQRELEEKIKQRDMETRKYLEIEEKVQRGQVEDLRRATTDLRTHGRKAAELHKQAREMEKWIQENKEREQQALENLHRQTAEQRQELERQIQEVKTQIEQHEAAIQVALKRGTVGVTRKQEGEAYLENEARIEELKQRLNSLQNTMNRLPR